MFLSKNQIRNISRQKRKNLSKKLLLYKSDIINNKIIDLLNNFECYIVLLYKDFDNEVSLDKVFQFCLNNKKKVYYPRVFGEDIDFYRVFGFSDFILGSYNILEPRLCNEKIKLEIGKKFEYIIFVPGIAFDVFGNRIGFGKGYYDKFLNKFVSSIDRKKFFVVGICYDFQIYRIDFLENLKLNYDFPMDLIITEKNIYC